MILVLQYTGLSSIFPFLVGFGITFRIEKVNKFKKKIKESIKIRYLFIFI